MLRTFTRVTRAANRCNGLSALYRSYSSPTTSRLKPAEALATKEDDYASYHSYTSDNRRTNSFPHLLQKPNNPQYIPPAPFSNDKLTLLPAPLPEDLKPTNTQSELYPSSSMLESLSLIHVCLRQRHTISRAHDILWQLIGDFEANRATLPNAQTWAGVIEGILSLAGDRKDPKAGQWTTKAGSLVAQWEILQGGRVDPQPSQPVPMGLNKGGEQVYKAYLRGLIASGQSVIPFLPYVASNRLSLVSLTSDFSVEMKDKTFAKLTAAAESEGNSDVLKIVQLAVGMEEDRRQRIAAVVPEEVNPIYAKEPFTTTLLRKIGDDIPADSPLPRFAIANLRATFKEVSPDEIPLRRQEQLEAASLAAARAELENAAQLLEEQGLSEVAGSQKLQSGKLQAWMWQWSKSLTQRLTKDIEALDRSSKQSDKDLLLYLRLLSMEKLALVTILETMRTSGSGGIADGMKVLRVLIQVGRAVETEYRAETIRSMLGKNSDAALNPSGEPQDGQRAVNRLWRKVGKQAQAEPNQDTKRSDDETPEEADRIDRLARHHAMEGLKRVWTPDWTHQNHLSIGAFLVSALVDTAEVTRTITDESGEVFSEQQPAFSHSYEYVRGNKLGIIRLNPDVASRMAKDRMGVVVSPKHMPMLIPPRQWNAHDDGAYLFHKVSAMRIKESLEQGSYLKIASENGKLDRVFRGLDVLSGTPWKVNRAVFDVMLKCWNNGDAVADFPASEEKSVYPIPKRPGPNDFEPASHAKYVSEMRDVDAMIKKDHSERCKFNYNLEMARSFLNDTFYIPHNLDFRGRAYPIPPHLNPVGDDSCRGLLMFGEKKPLGGRGLMWLRIHLANLYGFDKASFKDREQFAIDHEKDIFDSMDNPLEGNRWWLKAEEPWQCLAACYELGAALRSENPLEYLSSLPVHQDGTCNGMQHYAALGGDVQGATAVNLVGGDRPADVYTKIADLVNDIVNKDAADGKAFAQIAQGKITRKVVKQTVMTTVYGVTYIGAKAQIAKQLVAKGEIPREYIYHVSGYIASSVLNCIGDLFAGATAIQDWLTLSAKLITRSIPMTRVPESVKTLTKGNNVVCDTHGNAVDRTEKEFMTSVIWTSPLGLPIVQPYRKTARKQVMTALQSVYISDPNAVLEVAPGKQASAMPPNFIHSLDATHMLMCSARCRDDGVTFASVHDSYWSHASGIDQLSSNIRETFIELHSRDIIGDLRKEFIERYKDHVIPMAYVKTISQSKNRKNKTRRGAKADKEEEEVLPSEAVNDTEGQMEEESDEVKPKKRSRSTQAYLGDEADKIGLGSKQFARFVDVLPETPVKGEFDVNDVRSSPYFFS